MDVNSSFGIISWIVFGALAGWVASMIAGDDARQGWLGNIIVGIIGAFIGGLIFSLIGGGTFTLGWSIGSFIAAVIGAVILLFILRAVQGRLERHSPSSDVRAPRESTRGARLFVRFDSG
jgi:uncharacterized membrane protein YeaQ/YmgE (transglycosylase-associated protein family)